MENGSLPRFKLEASAPDQGARRVYVRRGLRMCPVPIGGSYRRLGTCRFSCEAIGHASL